MNTLALPALLTIDFNRAKTLPFVISVLTHSIILFFVYSNAFDEPITDAGFVDVAVITAPTTTLQTQKKLPSFARSSTANSRQATRSTVPTEIPKHDARDTLAAAKESAEIRDTDLRSLTEHATSLQHEDAGAIPLAGPNTDSVAAAYLAHVRMYISQNNYYPNASRSLGEEGVAVLRLTLERDGSLSQLEVLEPCEYHRLNDAALRAVTKAAPFGAFPSELPFRQWRITLPIRFTLTSG